MSRRQRARMRRRRMLRRAGIALTAAAFVCALAFIGYAIVGRQPARQSAYVVPEAETEVLAPPFMVEDEVRGSELTDEELEQLFAAAAQPTLPPMDEASFSFTLTAVGDCTLGGTTSNTSFNRFRKAVDENGTDYFLKNVRSIFEADDITLVNFEGTLTTSTEKRPNRPFNFRGDPDYVNILAGSSVEVCNMANNHAFDYVQQGFDDTTGLLRENGMEVCGFGLQCVLNVNGIDVGFLGFTEWDYTKQEIVSEIEAMRPNCDVLVVSMHWGKEKMYETTDLQRELAHAVVDAGADLVIGNHSHVVGEIENYNGVQIVYSLGNFCFGGSSRPFDTDAMIYQQTFVMGRDGVDSVSAKVYPISVSSTRTSNNFQPTLLTGEDASRVLTKIANNSDESGLARVEAVR